MGATVAACGLCPSAGLHLIRSSSLGQQAHGQGNMQRGHGRMPGMPFDDEDEDDEELWSDEEEEDADDMDVDALPSAPPDRAAIATAALARAAAMQAAGAAPPQPAPPPAPRAAAPPPPPVAPVARPSLGREAALAAAMARAAAAEAKRAEPITEDPPIPPPQAPLPPPLAPRQQPPVRDAAAQHRADLAMAAAQARAAAASSGAGAPRTSTSPTRVTGGAWRPHGAVASAQEAAQANAACERAAAAQRVERCRQLLEEDRSLRRFDPIMWPGKAAADGAGPSGSVAVVDPGAAAGQASSSTCRVRIIRPDGSALTLRLPPGGTLAALRLAALSSWQVQTAGTVPSQQDVALYGLVAHGGVELFGEEAMARTLAQSGLAGAAATLHLVHSRQRGVQARGVRPPGRGRHQHVQQHGYDNEEEEEEDEEEAADEVLAGLTGWVGPGALTYEQAMEVAHRLGVVEVATAPAVVAGLRTASWEGGAAGVASQESRCLCVICQCDMAVGQQVTHLPCAHALHEACAREWLGRATWCPLCKRRVSG